MTAIRAAARAALALSLALAGLAPGADAAEVHRALANPKTTEALAEAARKYAELSELDERWHASKGQPEEERWELLDAQLEAAHAEEMAMKQAVSAVAVRFHELYGDRQSPPEVWQEHYGAIRSEDGAIKARRENLRAFREKVLERGDTGHYFQYMTMMIHRGNIHSQRQILESFGRWVDALEGCDPGASDPGGLGGSCLLD